MPGRKRQSYTAIQRTLQEEEVLQKEKNSLSDSDAAKLKEQEEKLSSALADLEADRREKEKQKEKKEERRDTEQAIQAQQEKNDSQWTQTGRIPGRDGNRAGGCPFRRSRLPEAGNSG